MEHDNVTLDDPKNILLAPNPSVNQVVGVIGMGYVGLPLALAACKSRYNVIGFDINEKRVAGLNDGHSGIRHIDSALVAEALRQGKFRATSDMAEMVLADVLIIAVPTPLSKQREPDLTFVEKSVRSIAKSLRTGQLIILESTTWPGTTAEVVRPILEAGGLRAGVDFFLAFSPEREDPGNVSHSTTSIPKVVGADDRKSLELACEFYSRVVDKVVPVSTAATAEAVKLTENIFRSVNIALVNELKVIFEKMGIDVWDVIEAAKTKPFGYMPFYPGPGLGGHCIPIDPFYLTWKAREFEVPTRFIELAGEINTQMPLHVIRRLGEMLDFKASKGMNGSSVLLIGLAYKKNIDDIRESPSLKLIELLKERGCHVSYHDPYVPEIPRTREYADLMGQRSVALTAETDFAQFDAVLVATDHDAIDWSFISANAKLIVDTRNVFARLGIAGSNIVKA